MSITIEVSYEQRRRLIEAFNGRGMFWNTTTRELSLVDLPEIVFALPLEPDNKLEAHREQVLNLLTRIAVAAEKSLK